MRVDTHHLALGKRVPATYVPVAQNELHYEYNDKNEGEHEVQDVEQAQCHYNTDSNRQT